MLFVNVLACLVFSTHNDIFHSDSVFMLFDIMITCLPVHLQHLNYITLHYKNIDISVHYRTLSSEVIFSPLKVATESD